jgi:cytochrome c-type biogenesis protein CcmH/NrfG
MTGSYACRDEDEKDMNMRRSIGWVAVGVGMLASVVALAFFLGHWHMRTLDERGRALVAAEQYVPAIRVLSGIVAEAPGDARAHYYLGLAYAGVGLCGAASIHLWEAARLAPQYRRLFAGPGLACRNAASFGITGPIRSRGQD